MQYLNHVTRTRNHVVNLYHVTLYLVLVYVFHVTPGSLSTCTAWSELYLVVKHLNRVGMHLVEKLLEALGTFLQILLHTYK